MVHDLAHVPGATRAAATGRRLERMGTLHAPSSASPLFFFGIVSVGGSRYFFLRFVGLIWGAVRGVGCDATVMVVAAMLAWCGWRGAADAAATVK